MTMDVPGWEARGATLFRRFVFERYRDTRNFLDGLAKLSEEIGQHPQNINFAATYVNVTLEAEEADAPCEAEYNMASRLNALFEGMPGG